MNVALIGCGHIGGSLALALLERGVATRVVGYDVDRAATERARARGICGEVAESAEAAARGAELVVIATPVRSIAAVAAQVAPALAPGAVVTDVGSTKEGVVRGGEAAIGGRFVGGHPLAGTENAGPDAADAKLFEGRKVFLTPTAATDAAALARVEGVWRAIGAAVQRIDAAEHDRIMAAVSHLPHAIAYLLVTSIAAVGDGGRAFAGMAGGGFTDTTRIASTPAPMWVDVFLENRDALFPLLAEFAERLAQLIAAMADENGEAIASLIDEARAARARILEP